MRSKDESKITLVGENMDTLNEETFNMKVTDSRCTKKSLKRYLAQLFFERL